MTDQQTRHVFPRTLRPWAVALIALAMLAAQPIAARAQGAGDQAVIDRLERLERDIRTLNRQISRGQAAAPAPAGGSDGAAPQTPAAPSRALDIQPGEGSTARIFARLDALEREVRSLTGAQESLTHRLDQMAARLDKLLVDLDYRLARLEGDNKGSFSAAARGETAPRASAPPRPGSVTREGAMPPVGSGSGTVSADGAYQPGEGENVGTLGTVAKSNLDEIVKSAEGAAGDGNEGGGDAASETADETQTAATTAEQPADAAPAEQPAQAPAEPQTASILPEGTVEEQYRFAFDLTRQARFAEAEDAFKAFIGAHPDAVLADNARYWLAETYYVRKRYMDAAQAFFDAYKQAPDGPKAPDSLLKLGMSMVGLEKPNEACATFGKLRKEFTPLKANVEQALNREVQKLDCQ